MNNSANRATLISSVRTPLGFFTLILLICEAILGTLAFRATGADFSILIKGMLVIMVLLIVSVSIIAFSEKQRLRSRPGPAVVKRYDVFVASVLAGFKDETRLAKERECALAIVSQLERDCNCTVYYAGRSVNSTKDFDASDISARADLDALKQSRYFLLIYPEAILSSVLFEAGLALEICDASIYFVRNNQDLPYLMRRLTEAVGNVKSYTYDSTSDILAVLNLHRKTLFEDLAKRVPAKLLQ